MKWWQQIGNKVAKCFLFALSGQNKGVGKYFLLPLRLWSLLGNEVLLTSSQRPFWLIRAKNNGNQPTLLQNILVAHWCYNSFCRNKVTRTQRHLVWVLTSARHQLQYLMSFLAELYHPHSHAGSFPQQWLWVSLHRHSPKGDGTAWTSYLLVTLNLYSRFWLDFDPLLPAFLSSFSNIWSPDENPELD